MREMSLQQEGDGRGEKGYGDCVRSMEYSMPYVPNVMVIRGL